MASSGHSMRDILDHAIQTNDWDRLRPCSGTRSSARIKQAFQWRDSSGRL